LTNYNLNDFLDSLEYQIQIARKKGYFFYYLNQDTYIFANKYFGKIAIGEEPQISTKIDITNAFRQQDLDKTSEERERREEDND